MSSKESLRAELLRRRAGLSPQARTDAATPIADRVQAFLEERHAMCVALYLSTGLEPPTWQLADRLVASGVRVLAPVTRPGHRLGWAEYAGPDAVRAAAYGISEPTSPLLGPEALRDADVVLLPALAVDPAGHRLGRGAGYYDRALVDVDAGTPLVALVFDDEVLTDVPTEPHDVPVDLVVTPVRTVTTGGG
ncbi:5-formyltetrahydrofolate cyclo-ligase [Solicola gregarius]|uniref:5-formyltetrahydrofolate cyclo-ligase n=1 Tax=Solicola gregarius TaxID=2908642 RepID=A0AA46TJT4_9ACTN|nr:5-formyltetrahydrofolate cyclo-ligase [Solicola gregarius]UYM06637.1 5-formyltetrahydrofolate cyclo-ligase [Solicola gregarius]